MKPDEIALLAELQRRGRVAGDISGRTPRQLAAEPGFIMPIKRMWYLLDKWSSRDWYDYGVTVDLGWLTDKGRAIDTSGADRDLIYDPSKGKKRALD